MDLGIDISPTPTPYSPPPLPQQFTGFVWFGLPVVAENLRRNLEILMKYITTSNFPQAFPTYIHIL